MKIKQLTRRSGLENCPESSPLNDWASRMLSVRCFWHSAETNFLETLTHTWWIRSPAVGENWSNTTETKWQHLETKKSFQCWYLRICFGWQQGVCQSFIPLLVVSSRSQKLDSVAGSVRRKRLKKNEESEERRSDSAAQALRVSAFFERASFLCPFTVSASLVSHTNGNSLSQVEATEDDVVLLNAKVLPLIERSC